MGTNTMYTSWRKHKCTLDEGIVVDKAGYEATFSFQLIYISCMKCLNGMSVFLAATHCSCKVPVSSIACDKSFKQRTE